MKIGSENFELVGSAKLDTKKRVTLGAVFKKSRLFNEASVETFETFIGSEGDILLKPRVSIPARELWVHRNPNAAKDIQRGIEDVKQGRVTKVKDINKFIKHL